MPERRWWYRMGQQSYPQATELLITADSGGKMDREYGLWKVELQRSDEPASLPPAAGHRKWRNKIGLFSFISQLERESVTK